MIAQIKDNKIEICNIKYSQETILTKKNKIKSEIKSFECFGHFPFAKSHFENLNFFLNEKILSFNGRAQPALINNIVCGEKIE